jgi:hypothetical protein
MHVSVCVNQIDLLLASSYLHDSLEDRNRSKQILCMEARMIERRLAQFTCGVGVVIKKQHGHIPLFLIDSLKYHEAQTKDLPIPNDLISLGRKHWGTGYNYSEIFYHELKEHFEEE